MIPKNFKSMILAALIGAAFVPATGAQAASNISAFRCNACTYAQYEQTAIGRGLGKQYLYDFANTQILLFRVGQEPNGAGGYFYEAVEFPVEAEHVANFDRALYVYQHGGTLSKAASITLQGAPNTGGHSDDSVFSLFNSSGGMNTFGNWLGSYMRSQGVPVSPEIVQLHELIMANPTTEFVGDKSRLIIEVEFKDGIAEFELSPSEKRYKYKPGTAQDSNGTKIPETAAAARGIYYDFPGGPNSDAFRGFRSLMDYWRIPTGPGGWECGTASGGGSSSQTCVLMR